MDSVPKLSSSVRQRVSEDDLLNKSRVEESLSRSVPAANRTTGVSGSSLQHISHTQLR